MFAVAVWDQRRAPRRADPRPARASSRSTTRSPATASSSAPSSSACSPAGWSSDELDPEAISAYLMLGYVPGRDDAAARTSASCCPGERLVVDGRQRARLERWWHYPAPEPDTTPRTAEEWAEIVLAKLDESVRLRLMSDVPLGAMLSGGLDSSLIVALMARHMTEPLETFAVGFAGEDSELAGRAPRRRRARRRATTSSRSRCSSDPDDLARLIWHLDEPLADLSSIGFLALCELAAEHVTVALSGQGADELFGGYRKHRVASLAEQLGPGARRAARAAPPPRCAAAPAAPARLADALQAQRSRSRACSPPAASCTPTCAASCSAARCAEHAGAAERVVRGTLAGAPGRRAAGGRALPRRPARPRRRHAHLLRPRVDGVLARGPRAVPRPRARRAVRARSRPRTRSTACRASTSCALAATRPACPTSCSPRSKRGFFNEAVGDLGRRRRRRARRQLLLAPDPAYAAGHRPGRGRAAPSREWRAGAPATRSCCSRS